MAPNISIYSTPTCPYCHMAKDYFKSKNLAYTDYDVASNIEKRKEMIEKTGQLGVPVITIDDHIIIGFDQEEIDKALKH